MEQTVFVEMKFWLLVLFSLVVPVGIVWISLSMRAVVLPALLAGVGVNVTSHVLIQHLTDAQRRLVRGAQRQPRTHALMEGAPAPAPRVPPTATRPDVAIQ